MTDDTFDTGNPCDGCGKRHASSRSHFIPQGLNSFTSSHHWLSFVGRKRNLGVAVVAGYTLSSAADEAWSRRCNPGGEVLGVPLSTADLERLDRCGIPRNRLVNRVDAEHLVGPGRW